MVRAMELTFREVEPGYDFTGVMECIPELRGVSREVVEARLGNGGVRLVAERDGRPVGFKLGYAVSPEVFYSWLGGVAAECRGLGVARRLMEMQEDLVRSRGFRVVRVKSMNRFPAMLRMLVSAGYEIKDVEKKQAEVKVVFEKVVG